VPAFVEDPDFLWSLSESMSLMKLINANKLQEIGERVEWYYKARLAHNHLVTQYCLPT
jgi:hypothetical protein